MGCKRSAGWGSAVRRDSSLSAGKSAFCRGRRARLLTPKGATETPGAEAEPGEKAHQLATPALGMRLHRHSATAFFEVNF